MVVAGSFAFLAFRLCQPDAFAGLGLSPDVVGQQRFEEITALAPSWWHQVYDLMPRPLRALVLPSPRWLNNMETIRSQMTGDVDFPPNHQWTDRTPIVFPWRNMVLYGLGPLLGLAAWAGWLIAGWRLVRARTDWQQHVFPVLWVGVFFLYQGTQWVKSMRYLMPIYPALVLLAAWLLHDAWSRAAASGRVDDGKLARSRLWLVTKWAALGLAALVCLTTWAWAFTFVRIYRQPTTRVAAARWVYQNVPTGATLLVEPADPNSSVQRVQVHVPRIEYAEDGWRTVTAFELPTDGTATGLRLNYLSDPAMDVESEVIRVSIGTDSQGTGELTTGVLSADLRPVRSVRGDAHLVELEPVSLTEGQSYYLTLEAVAGAPIRSTGAYLINESSWDDGLPLRLDGLDGFTIYEGEPLELYWEDNEEKRARLIRLLDEGEYLFITSSRQLGSIPRMPTRYPLTIAYYQALFEGRLGYQLVETFFADLQIGPLNVNDVFGKVEWGTTPAVGWPPPDEWAAEEAFSVYDHPPVWIFVKSDDYSPAAVRAVLDEVDVSQRQFIIPYDYTQELWAQRRPTWLNQLLGKRSITPVTAEPVEERSMWLEEDVLEAQQAGGTWRDLFDTGSPLNRFPGLAAVTWWLTVVLGGWLVFPIALAVFPGLPSRGYVLSKVLCLVLVAWLVWILTCIHLTDYTRNAIWLAVGLVAAMAALAARWQWPALVRLVKCRWRWMLAVEGIGLGLFLLFLAIRSGNPDLWHPVFGGEKPMDLAFLNAIVKSTQFPPYDPWLSGAYINYYYFGFVIIGNLVKILGIVPHVAYNLALPMLYSLTGLGAFSVAYDLVAGKDRSNDPIERTRRALAAGLAAACLAVLLGNLGQLATVLSGWHRLGQAAAGEDAVWLVQAGRGLLENLRGAALPMHTGSWYWDATRIIPPAAGEAGPITEFPFFTFLYADLHAHMIDMPLVLLALAWALALAQAADRGVLGQGRHWGATRLISRLALIWVVGGIVIGALRATNTWDWPASLGVACVAIAYSAWRARPSAGGWLLLAGLGAAALVGLNVLAYLPYTRQFVPAYTQVMAWRGGVTPVWAYLSVHGLFLFLLLTWAVREYRDWTRSLTLDALRAWEPFALLVALAVMGCLVAMVVLLRSGVSVGPLVLVVAVPVTMLALQRRLAAERRAVLMLLTLGLVMTLAVELIVLSGDISRMNTVFKFYMQVWLLFSVTGGAALIWVWEWSSAWRPAWRQAWFGILGLLVFAAALYPVTASRAKVLDRFHADQPPAGLDGMVYMRTATHYDRDQVILLESDYQAIRWLQENVDGSPVIMEANTYPKIYGWGSRISIYTGLPTVVGWEWHTRQHRAGFTDATELVRQRANEVITFYNTPDVYQADRILDKFRVQYVVVGSLERAYYSAVGLNKFELMEELGLLEEVYRNAGAEIYRVR
jgi:YYY domain-containing protein